MERLLKRFLEHHRIRSCRTSIKCCNGTCSIPSQTVKRRWHAHPWDVPKNGEQSRMKCEASQVTGFKGPNRLWPRVTMFHRNLSQVAVVAGGRRSKWTLRHGNANVLLGSYKLCNTMYASFLPCGLDQSVYHCIPKKRMASISRSQRLKETLPCAGQLVQEQTFHTTGGAKSFWTSKAGQIKKRNKERLVCGFIMFQLYSIYSMQFRSNQLGIIPWSKTRPGCTLGPAVYARTPPYLMAPSAASLEPTLTNDFSTSWKIKQGKHMPLWSNVILTVMNMPKQLCELISKIA